ncbi:MAG: DUF1295 domain-containing protein [Bacteroidota bacterium]|nr:DUF1295 domain-containing protein [Bacteroidota bacterium]
MRKDRFILLGIYAVTAGVSYIVGASYEEFGLLGKACMGILSASIILWLFSFLSDNSSVFDPYWSVAPFLFITFLFVEGNETALFKKGNYPDYHQIARFFTVAVLVTLYGIRLTWNFVRKWKGLKHEDWRYANLRGKTGFWYWTVSLLGIHIFPAMMVFLGSFSLWVVEVKSCNPLNFLDILGLLVTGFGIWMEAAADKQLFDFLKNGSPKNITLKEGLWSFSRHPNYLGEIFFWWGLYFFALAANPAQWWVIIGPAGITIMFLFISIPIMEKRMKERKEDYEDYCAKVPLLLPFRIKKTL